MSAEHENCAKNLHNIGSIGGGGLVEKHPGAITEPPKQILYKNRLGGIHI